MVNLKSTHGLTLIMIFLNSHVMHIINFIIIKYLAIYGVSMSSSYKYWADGSSIDMVSTDGSSRKTAQNSAETLVSKITEPATWKKFESKSFRQVA